MGNTEEYTWHRSQVGFILLWIPLRTHHQPIWTNNVGAMVTEETTVWAPGGLPAGPHLHMLAGLFTDGTRPTRGINKSISLTVEVTRSYRTVILWRAERFVKICGHTRI